VYTYDSGLDVSTAALAQASMPEDDYNAPYARKAAILAGLGLVNGAPPPASTPRVHAELVRVTCDAERAECTLTPDESAGVVTLTLDIVPDGGLDLALSAHESGLIRYLETAWDRWARLPPSARCRFFRRPMPSSPSSSSSSVPALVPSNFCARHERATREPGSGVHAQTCFYHTDDETPVFKALLPSLVADVAVVNRVRVELQRDLSFILGGGGGPASRLHPPRRAYHYALVSHPGHHAGRGRRSASLCRGARHGTRGTNPRSPGRSPPSRGTTRASSSSRSGWTRTRPIPCRSARPRGWR
jgi:hypothetical protein